MNLDQLGTKLIMSTAPLMVIREDNTKSSGTAFFYNIKVDGKEEIYPFLVTNHHVIKNAKEIYTQLNGLGEDNLPNKENSISVSLNKDMFFSDIENDLSIIPIGFVLNKLIQENKKPFFIGVDNSIVIKPEESEKLSAIEEITFIGYPLGIFDHINNLPIVRQGITATPIWNDFKGDKRFLIDASSFPGSSGSPVFIYNEGNYAIENGIAFGSRIYFVGVLTESHYQNDGQFIDLGVVIKSEILVEFINKVYKELEEK